MADEPTPTVRASFGDAAAYWERRRITFNLTLAAVVIFWLVVRWPQFLDALTGRALLILAVFALAANACYTLIYILDLPLQRSLRGGAWRAARRTVWLVMTAIAVIVLNDWIADEIYPRAAR